MREASDFESSIPAWQGETDWLHVAAERPLRMDRMHWHSHVELNFSTRCALTYQTGPQRIKVPVGHIAVFWAAVPHKVVDVCGDGDFTCIYISLEEFMRWPLPVRFSHSLMHGRFVVSGRRDDADAPAFARWLADYASPDRAWRRQALDEIALRVRRLALAEDRNAGNAGPGPGAHPASARGMPHVEAMASFIAGHFADPLDVASVAGHVGLHPNYAMGVFKRAVGLSISAYITRHRLSHAQAQLLNTERNVASIAMDCGFGSLSSFYQAFRGQLERTPSAYRREHRG